MAARQGTPLFPIVGLPRVGDLARSAMLASDLVLIPVQPSPYDVWAAEETVKLLEEARVLKENLKAACTVNRKIANTSFGRDVADILAQFPLPTLSATLTQRVNCPEAAAGKAVFELDPNGPAQAEVAALIDEMLAMLDEVPA